MNLIPSLPFTSPVANSLSAINDSTSRSSFDGMDLSTLQSVGDEFESVFFSMLLKEMRNSLDTTGEGGLFAGEKSDTLGSLFDLYMGQHLASSNSMGISRAIVSYLSNQPKNVLPTLDAPAME